MQELVLCPHAWVKYPKPLRCCISLSHQAGQQHMKIKWGGKNNVRSIFLRAFSMPLYLLKMKLSRVSVQKKKEKRKREYFLTPRFSRSSVRVFIISKAFIVSTKKLTLCGLCSVSACSSPLKLNPIAIITYTCTAVLIFHINTFIYKCPESCIQYSRLRCSIRFQTIDAN